MHTIISAGKEFEATLGNDGLTQVITKMITAHGSIKLSLMNCRKAAVMTLIKGYKACSCCHTDRLGNWA